MSEKIRIEQTIEDKKIPSDVTITDLDLQSIQTQTSLDKAFSELFNQISLEKKTEFLKNDEIKKLGTLHTMAKHYGFIALQERIVKHMEMRISLKREGRKEAVTIVQAERQHEEMKNMLDKYSRSGPQ
jgi:pantoate kinase